MNSVGIDTSIIIRLLINDSENSVKKILKKLQTLKMNRTKIFVSDFVIYESYFVLKKEYEIPDKEIASNILNVINSGIILPEPGSSIIELLQSMNKKLSPGFADRIIQMHYLNFCNEIITLDKKFSRLEKVSLI